MTRKLSLLTSCLAIWVATLGYAAQTYAFAVHTSHHLAEKMTATTSSIEQGNCPICDGIQTSSRASGIVLEIKPDLLLEMDQGPSLARPLIKFRFLPFGSRAPPSSPV